MEPILELQLVRGIKSYVRQIVRDELKLLINEQTINEKSLTQINSLEASILNIVSSKIGWLKGENTLLLFYNLLISHGFITRDLETFKIHFIGNSGAIEKIKWNTQTTRLVYLFNQLLLYHFIHVNSTRQQL